MFRFLNLRTIKIPVLEKKAKPLLEVPAASLVQSQELFGVQKTELGHVADEFKVAGSQFEGVGFVATDELLTTRFWHGFHLKLYAKATPEPRPPFVLSRYLFPRTPPTTSKKKRRDRRREAEEQARHPRLLNGAEDSRPSGVK